MNVCSVAATGETEELNLFYLNSRTGRVATTLLGAHRECTFAREHGSGRIPHTRIPESDLLPMLIGLSGDNRHRAPVVP